MGGVDSGTPSGGDAVQRPTATLLLSGPSADGSGGADCPDVRPDETDVLVVSTERTVQDAVSDWRDAAGALPSRLGLVTFAEFDRSAAASDQPSRRPLPGADITLTAMSDPENLRRLGTAVTLYLDDWVDDGNDTLVYVDALAPFVEASGPESTFQFLHLLVQSVDQLDATLVARLDPAAIDERTVNTLGSLFDEVTEPAGATGTDALASLDADAIHDLLGNARRRFVLRALYEESPLGLEELSAELARHESETDDPGEATRHRVYTALASVHVPRLAEANVVTFDRAAGRVGLSEAARGADRIEAFLDRSFDDD
jgi:hypothetical protein